LSSSKPSLRELVISWVGSELRKRGFDVRKNATIECGGVSHRFDVLAETTILENVRIRVGVVLLDKRLSVEDVEKAIAWRDVLGVDKVIFVALEGVENGAAALAMRRGVSVVMVPENLLKPEPASQRDMLSQAPWLHVEPLSNVGEAVELLERIARGGFVRRHGVSIASVALLFIPVIELQIEVGAEGGEVVEGVVTIEGLRGYFFKPRNRGVEIDVESGTVAEITSDVIAFVKLLRERGYPLTLAEVREALGIASERINEIVELLERLGAVDRYGDIVEFRGLGLEEFESVESIAKRLGAPLHVGAPENGVGRAVLEVVVSPTPIENLVEAMGGKVMGVRIVYYPVYVALATEKRGGALHEKLVAVDGLAMEELRGFEVLASDPRLIDIVKKVGDLREAQRDRRS